MAEGACLCWQALEATEGKTRRKRKMKYLPVENAKIVQGVFPQACTSIAGDWVSLKNYRHLTILIHLDVASGTASGAVTLDQATAVAGTGTKTLAFTKMWANEDTSASDALVETAVTSNTFNIGGATKPMLYVIEVEADTLDVENDFDCVQVDIATIANANVCVEYILSQARYSGQSSAMPSAIID